HSLLFLSWEHVPSAVWRFCACGRSGASRRRSGSTRGIEVALEALEVGAQFRGGLTAQIAILLQSFSDDPFQLTGRLRIVFRQGRRRFVENLMKDDRGSIAGEGLLARGHFVEYNAERKKIGARVEFLAPGLFG